MTHKLIVETAKAIAAAACEMKMSDRTDGKGLNRRFRRIWRHQNKALVTAYRLRYGHKPDPEQLFGELNWTDYVEDARKTLVAMLRSESTTVKVKDKIAKALIDDRNAEYEAHSSHVKRDMPAPLYLNPDHPGRIERELFGED